ncbi:hypothetical protein RchiOBHm_Chr5g0018851 [Rosa chinensis]|uniref:Uncharacterized protein n=1 Tax=Rosa chinensis TaxID=74649 RepID=A0A2P6Q6T8_ROSCH|nr:hypothetical protein RchiOBHm_Chr5g0018851 [Rosa chinensis]
MWAAIDGVSKASQGSEYWQSVPVLHVCTVLYDEALPTFLPFTQYCTMKHCLLFYRL